MIGIDTNILLRLYQQDDALQFAMAQNFIKLNAPVFISTIVLVEFGWVCRSKFGLSRAEICKRLQATVDALEFEFAHKGAVQRAVHEFATRKGDFADYLIAETNQANGCATTMTFDIAASASNAFTLMESL